MGTFKAIRRHRLGLTVRELSALLGCTGSSVSHNESDVAGHKASTQALYCLLDVFGDEAIKVLLFNHTLSRKEITKEDLQALVCIAQKKLHRSEDGEVSSEERSKHSFERWVLLMKRQFPNEDWNHLLRQKEKVKRK